MSFNAVHRVEQVGEGFLLLAFGSLEYNGITDDTYFVGFEATVLCHELAHVVVVVHHHLNGCSRTSLDHW